MASGGACVTPEPNCLLGHDFCKTSNVDCSPLWNLLSLDTANLSEPIGWFLRTNLTEAD